MPLTEDSIREKKEPDSQAFILIKYGGNAMTNPDLQLEVIERVARLHRSGVRVVLVHGGGPFIKENLERAKLQAEFIGGHRVTDAAAMSEVQQALRGRVNGDLVKVCSKLGLPAVGISGKDGGLVRAKKRWHIHPDTEQKTDLGYVGDIASVQPHLIHTLLEAGYLPVVSPVSLGQDGEDYNINADMFAGHLAGALKVDAYLILTDIDGLRTDIGRPETHINAISLSELLALPPGVIQGGMIPKIAGCRAALELGAKRCQIINGTKPDALLAALEASAQVGTNIYA